MIGEEHSFEIDIRDGLDRPGKLRAYVNTDLDVVLLDPRGFAVKLHPKDAEELSASATNLANVARMHRRRTPR